MTISKSDAKLGENWVKNLQGKIVNWDLNGETFEQILTRYAHEKNGHGAEVLADALNKNIIPIPNSKDAKSTLLYYCTDRAIFENNASERDRIIQAIKLLLQYGSKAHAHSPSPLMQIFSDSSQINACRAKHQFSEILKPFLEDPANLTVMTERNASLAHLAASFSCGSLPLILNKKPELVDSRMSAGTTPVCIAIQAQNTRNALELIVKRKANLQMLNDKNQSALTAAICYNNPTVIQALLIHGAPIEPKTQVGFSNEVKTLTYLAKAGYFLTDRGFPPKPKINLANFDYEKINLNCFFMLTNEEGTQCEYITFASQLDKCKIAPSQAQISRLHQSFQEIALINKSSDFESLYHAFKTKFPLNEKTELKLGIESDRKAEIIDENTFQRLFTSAVIHQESAAKLLACHTLLADFFNSDSLKNLTVLEMTNAINNLYKASVKYMSLTISTDPKHNPFITFSFKLHYQFSIKLIRQFIERATKEEITQIHTQIIMIVSLATNHGNKLKNKSSHKMIALFDFLIKSYYDKNMLSLSIQQFQLMRNIHIIVAYSEAGLYDDVISAINHSKNLSTAFSKNDFCRSAIVNISLALVNCLSQSKINSNDMLKQIDLLDCIESFAKELLYKRDDYKDQYDCIKMYLHAKRVNVSDLYKMIAKDLKVGSDALYTLGDFSDTSIKFTFNQSSLIDSTLLRAKLKKIPHIDWTVDAYHLKLSGVSLQEIGECLHALDAIILDDIKIRPKKDTVANTQDSTSSFYVETQTEAKKQIIKKEKNKMPEPIPVQLTAIVSKEVSLANQRRIKTEIITALNLLDNADLFHIDHPGFPENRRDFCFGLWCDISGKNAGDIPQATLRSHHDLAHTGKVVTYSYNQNGLKATKVIDATTGEYVEGLKTKKSADDLRINSAPVKVRINQKEEVLLYVFGVATDHKQEAPKIDPAVVIASATKQSRK